MSKTELYKHLIDAREQMKQFQEINENTFRNFMIFSQMRIIELLEESLTPQVVNMEVPKQPDKPSEKGKVKK